MRLEVVVVSLNFQPNQDDPYFFDILDRTGSKATLLQEMQWESEKENGTTYMLLEDWLRYQRVVRDYVDVSLMPPWEQVQPPPRPLRAPFVRACYKKAQF